MTDRAKHLASLAFKLGEIDRATCHPDLRPETVATHTAMLCLMVMDLGPDAGVDVGQALQFAVVHDLPEVYAGDVNTCRPLSPEARVLKDVRDAAAIDRLREELPRSRVNQSIRLYEARTTKEARFVWGIDKMLPMLTYLLNDAASARAQDLSEGEFLEITAARFEGMWEMATEFPVLGDLYIAARTEVARMLRRHIR